MARAGDGAVGDPRSRDGLSREVPAARLWGAILTAIPLVLAVVLGGSPCARLDLVVLIGSACSASSSR